MAGNTGNLIPRRKGESKEAFVARAKVETKKRRGIISKSGKGRDLTKYIPRPDRQELRKGSERPTMRKQERYVTKGIKIGNPFKGEDTGRIRERVRA